jgi:hypothetical protein
MSGTISVLSFEPFQVMNSLREEQRGGDAGEDRHREGVGTEHRAAANRQREDQQAGDRGTAHQVVGNQTARSSLRGAYDINSADSRTSGNVRWRWVRLGGVG